MTILGATTAGTSGPYLGVNGSASANGMNLRDSHTIMCRIRHTSTATNYDSWFLGLQNGGAAIGSGAGTFIGRSNGLTSSALESYRFNGSFSFNSVEVPSTYGNTTDWHHIAVVYDNPGTDLDVYVDGVFSVTVNSSTTFVTSTTNLRMIVAQHPGALCDVAFFSRALSAEEIAYCAARRNAPGQLANCFGWYPSIDADLASMQVDRSPNGNNLSLLQSGSNNPSAGSDSVPVAWATRANRIWVPLSTPINFSSGTATTPTAAIGTLQLRKIFSGTAAAPSAATGATAIKNQFSGAVASPSGASGTLAVRKIFTGAVATSPTAATGAAQSRIVFGGVMTSPSAMQGTGQSRIVFGGNAASPTACTGGLTLLGITSFSGVSTSPTACTALMNVRKTTGGIVTSPSAATGGMQVRKSSAASATSPSACSGGLNVYKYVGGTITSPSACQGFQSGGTVIAPIAPEDPRVTQKRRTAAIGLYRRPGRH
jgi:hypothetical protein